MKTGIQGLKSSEIQVAAAPVRFSTKTVCLSDSCMRAAIMRTTKSEPLPGGKGQINLIGRSGYAAQAKAGSAAASKAIKRLRENRGACEVILSPVGFSPRARGPAP